MRPCCISDQTLLHRKSTLPLPDFSVISRWIFLATLPAMAAFSAPPPAWDAAGLGPIPRQAISTHDVSDDGARLAVGTIAAPGDPNVFLLNAAGGRVIARWQAGLRWVEKVVAGPGDTVYALVTMTDGTAEDFPKVFVCVPDHEPVAVPVQAGQGEYLQSVFHWGGASNHFGGLQLCGTKTGAAIVAVDQVLWIEGAHADPVARGRFPRLNDAVTVSAAANDAGWVVVGCAAPEGTANLFLFEPHGAKPLWSRIAEANGDGPRPEPGEYGSPTLPGGGREPLPQRDVALFAPLSIAIRGREKPESIAIAEYRGWQRWVRSLATFKQQNHGLRFLPARPVVSQLNGSGETLNRESAPEGWVDLSFADGRTEPALMPHTWTCRGLAGRARLPLEPYTDFQSPIAGEPVIIGSTVSHRGWSVDLEKAAPPAEKPWVAKASALALGEGVWQLSGGRFHSDGGGQRLIEAPDGLILIEAHAGLSFESEWAAIRSAGHDPMRVKFVLATHEHGDHSPGAYLWRVVTGAKFVCSAEMAYHLRHQLPLGTGYGFHPPNPTDIVIREDTDLDLAGLTVRAVRLPGHTAGSMGWTFVKGGVRYLAIGDLIMPSGTLGYAGSVNFSARDVLDSLRKIEALRPDFILPGHGPHGDPAPYLAGIRTGAATGWARVMPEKPDPFFNVSEPARYRVVGWNQEAVSAAVGDYNADSLPDVAIVRLPREGQPSLGVFLNQGGRFPATASLDIPLPGLEPTRVLTANLDDDGVDDPVVAGQSVIWKFPSRNGQLNPEPVILTAPPDVIRIRRFAGENVVATAMGGFHHETSRNGRAVIDRLETFSRAVYGDLLIRDFDGDGREDAISSGGESVLTGGAALTLPPPPGPDWTYAASGDFNGDQRPDFVMLTASMENDCGVAKIAVHLNTGQSAVPFDAPKAVQFSIPTVSRLNPRGRQMLQRSTPAVADWNRDGFDDLVFAAGQGDQVEILHGGADGLSPGRLESIPMDFMLHFHHGVEVADFDGDGSPDLACFGNTLAAGVGGSKDGPTALFIRLTKP